MLDDVVANRPRFNPTAGDSRVVGPHLIVVLDGGDVLGSDHLMTDGGVEGVTILDLTDPAAAVLDQSTLVLDVAADGALSSTTFEGKATVGPGRPAQPGGGRGPGAAVGAAAAVRALPLGAAYHRHDRPLRPAGDRSTGRVRPGPALDPATAARPAAGTDRLVAGRQRRSNSTSRSRRRTGWARTGCSSGPPAPASPSCCARWSSRSRSRTAPRYSTSYSSTSRAAPPSPSSTCCRTPAR